MGVSKYRITLIEEEKELLKVISRKHKESQNIVRRAKIILRANEGVQRQAIAAELDINEPGHRMDQALAREKRGPCY